MTMKRFVTAAALLLLATSSGCCRWWCDHCGYGQPAAAGYPVAAPASCGCYTQPAYYPPAPAAAPANWAQPQTRPLTGCTCTCPP